MSHPHQDRHALDPSPGEPLRFVRAGKRWVIGNGPTRLAVEVAENDDGEAEVREFDPVTWERVEDEAA